MSCVHSMWRTSVLQIASICGLDPFVLASRNYFVPKSGIAYTFGRRKCYIDELEKCGFSYQGLFSEPEHVCLCYMKLQRYVAVFVIIIQRRSTKYE